MRGTPTGRLRSSMRPPKVQKRRVANRNQGRRDLRRTVIWSTLRLTTPDNASSSGTPRAEGGRIIDHVKIALLLVLAPSLASAEERATTFTLGGMAGGFESARHELGADGMVGPRLTLAWEHAPLALPDAPGYTFRGALVPELFGGAFVLEDRAQMFIGAGVRAELKMAQREMGLLKVSARGAAYLA